MSSAESDSWIGATIVGYRVEAVLGRGGMGVVYRAEHLALGRKVALKVLAPELAANESFRQRFVYESRMAASLDHPNIIPIYEAGEAEELLFLAMRYVDGPDLGRMIRQYGRLGPERTVRVVAQVASALDAAHARGLVHRDVKPANVLVSNVPGEGGLHAYLCDFGLIKAANTEGASTITSQFMGTVPYMSPEQIEGEPMDGRADLYSLACVAFRGLTGKLPFKRDTDMATVAAHLHEPPPRASEWAPELPPTVDAVLARALGKHRDERYPTCTEFAHALRMVLDENPPHESGSHFASLVTAGGSAFAGGAPVPGTTRTGYGTEVLPPSPEPAREEYAAAPAEARAGGHGYGPQHVRDDRAFGAGPGSTGLPDAPWEGPVPAGTPHRGPGTALEPGGYGHSSPTPRTRPVAGGRSARHTPARPPLAERIPGWAGGGQVRPGGKRVARSPLPALNAQLVMIGVIALSCAGALVALLAWGVNSLGDNDETVASPDEVNNRSTAEVDLAAAGSADGEPAQTCGQGWTTPERGTPERTTPLDAMRDAQGLDGLFVIPEMRQFTGADGSTWWYVRTSRLEDEAYAARWLVRDGGDGARLVAVAAPETGGLRAPDWHGLGGGTGSAELPGLPGSWQGQTYDYVTRAANGPAWLPDGTRGCLAGS